MRTQMLGHVDLDHDQLTRELQNSEELPHHEPYAEFQCSRRPWKTCMLWAPNGEVREGVIADYDTELRAEPTAYGAQLPYLCSLIESTFATEHLLFARLVVMMENVLVPHRDYLEFSEVQERRVAMHRLHIPLATADDCLFMEDNQIYRMRLGDIWSLDVSQLHGAAVLGETRRVHLIVDFAGGPHPFDLVRFPVETQPGIPERDRVDRPALSDDERAGLQALGRVLDAENLPEVFGIIIRRHYRRDGGENFAWRMLYELGRANGDPDIVAHIEALHRHCALERSL